MSCAWRTAAWRGLNLESRTVSANHGFDFTGGIVDGQKRGLAAGLLLELHAHGSVRAIPESRIAPGHAYFQEIAGFLAAGPGQIHWPRESRVRADFDDRVFVAPGEDKSRDVIPFSIAWRQSSSSLRFPACQDCPRKTFGKFPFHPWRRS